MSYQDLSGNDFKVALKGFFSIAKIWELSEQEQKALLGISEDETLHEWKTGLGPSPQWEVVERISCVFGVYKALRTLFPTEERAAAWVKKPNKQFENRPALEVMLNDPCFVRRYLDAQCQ